MFNKFPFYRILVLFTLFSMSLTACNAAPTLTAPEATPVPIATPTPRLTEIPTVVPTPTEIPDPTMPLGETGKDAEGKYVKMENGDIARKVEYKNSAGEILYEGWVVEKTQKGGIPLLDYSDANLIPSWLLVDPAVLGGHEIQSLTHKDNIEGSSGPDSLTAAAQTELYHQKNIDTSDQDAMRTFRLEVLEGIATVPIITSTGGVVESELGPKKGFITIVVPYESLVPAEGSGISEWLDPYPDSRRSFRSTALGVSSDGNTICLVGSQASLNELPDKLIRALDLLCFANIVDKVDQKETGFPSVLQHFVKFADAGGAEKVPDIIVTRNP